MIENLKESLAGLQIVESKILEDIAKYPNDMNLKEHLAGVRTTISERENQIKDLEAAQ